MHHWPWLAKLLNQHIRIFRALWAIPSWQFLMDFRWRTTLLWTDAW